MTHYTSDGSTLSVTPAERRRELVSHALRQIMWLETCNGAQESEPHKWLSPRLRKLEETIREIGGAP